MQQRAAPLALIPYMAAKIHTSKTSTKKKSSGKAYAKSSRCWPGYEPVPGKSEHEEGSCRKKPASRNGGKEVNRETARNKQIAQAGKRAQHAKSNHPRHPSAAPSAKRRAS
jgi:hypothetical protein